MTVNAQEIINSEVTSDVIALCMNLLYAVVILAVAGIAAKWIRYRIVSISVSYKNLDSTLFKFLGNLVKYLILAVAVIFVLNRFGIQTTSLVALVGAAGIAIGLALQGTLSNIAAGVMLILFRPFQAGQFINAASQAGTVEGISLLYTELRTYDGLQAIIPNKDIWASAIVNFSVNKQRLIDLTIGVSYSSNLKKTASVLEAVAARDPRVLRDPAPFIKVKELGDSSIDFVFRVWVAGADWWVTKCEITEQIKLALDEAGIDIPFPTRTLHVAHQPAQGTAPLAS